MEKTSVIVIFYVYLKFSLNFSYIFLGADADELSQDTHNVNHCIFHTEQIQIL